MQPAPTSPDCLYETPAQNQAAWRHGEISFLSPFSASPLGAAVWGAGTTQPPSRGWIPCSPTSLCGPEPSPAPRRHAAWSEPVPREINYFGASLPLTQAAFLPNFSPLRISALPWDLLLSLLSTSEQDGGGTRKGKLGTLGTPRARSQPCQQPLLWPWPCLHSPGEQLELAGKLFCLYSTEHVLLHPRWGASRLAYPHSEGIMLFNPSPTRKPRSYKHRAAPGGTSPSEASSRSAPTN